MNIKENFHNKLQIIREQAEQLNELHGKSKENEIYEAKLSYDEFVKGRVTKDSDTQTLKDMIKKNNKNRGGGSRIMNRKYKKELERRSSLKEEEQQLNELHGKSKEAAEMIKARIEKKHDEKWEETHEKRAKEKLKGSEKTKDIDKERNNLAKRWLRADRYSKKLEEATKKPDRTEHSWPTRLNKKTGKWGWANSFTSGHASAEEADRHAKTEMEKAKRTKVKLSDLKPG